MTQLSTATRAEGVGYGIMAFSTLFLLGGLLTATIIGAIIGVPMIVISLWKLCSSPWQYKNLLAGACPYCSERCYLPVGVKSRKCPACRMRLINRNGYLTKVEDCEGDAKSS